ncbi:vWA domain-containing protein [Simiduia agarivorans]|uniref:VWFA domain-containing protein n=1 Tax=Simiduia agarivorans (strain DSM 21679 / JCM 13881 / BCRC 17597 / SA1) TaxID=1117647 RepID=K4KER9_SIMAS|nr:VWA domain-containing protein [Simiduia agarivorans]AFU97436.1 hypothetical protein M5M_01015 [Simiduia agarivorans SA1 = DSM 21679]
MTMPDALHFARPLWLLALLVIPLVLWLFVRTRKRRGHWHRYIDPSLLPFLAMPSNTRSSQLQAPLLASVMVLLVIAAAGPSWERKPLPVMKSEAATVYILDLSPSMLAEDVKPSRLVRARQKLSDALKADTEGLKALVVYAGEAHLVTPLTDDARTLISLVPSLSPRIMPLTGSNIEMALALANDTLTSSRIKNGQVVLLTDGITPDSLNAAKSALLKAGYPLFIIGLGNESGAPIPLGQQGFAKTPDGEVVIARNDRALLRELASATGGEYRDITLDDSDLIFLQRKHQTPKADGRQVEREFDQWIDRGHWLVWIALPLAFMAFRQKALLSLMLCGIMVSAVVSPNASAQDPAGANQPSALWPSLWLNNNQRGAQALENDDPAAAADAFTDPRWKAYAQYKAGNFPAAQSALSEVEPGSASDWYNLGNTQAQAGNLQAALNSYDQALAINPDMADALHNKQVVQQALEQQQESQNQNQNQDQDQDHSEDQNQPQAGQQQNQSDAGQQGDGQPSQEQGDNTAGQQQKPKSQEADSIPPTDSDPANDQAGDSQGEQDQGELDARRGNESDRRRQDALPEQQPRPSAENPVPQSAPDEPQQADGDQSSAAIDAFSDLNDEQRQAAEQWLNRIEDDPSNLLKRKFEYQYRQRKQAIRNDEWTAPENNAHERW